MYLTVFHCQQWLQAMRRKGKGMKEESPSRGMTDLEDSKSQRSEVEAIALFTHFRTVSRHFLLQMFLSICYVLGIVPSVRI